MIDGETHGQPDHSAQATVEKTCPFAGNLTISVRESHCTFHGSTNGRAFSGKHPSFRTHRCSSILYGISGPSCVDSAYPWKWYSNKYIGHGCKGCGALSQPFLSVKVHYEESRFIPGLDYILHGSPM